MPDAQRLTTCLWFDDEAEQAAELYISIFPNSRITAITRYGEAGKEFHHKEPGSVMTVAFELDGHEFTALNGGPVFQFSEAISFQVMCDSQEEIDHYWERLSEGGDPNAQQCGWLKDRFGVSWQVIPRKLPELLGGDAEAAERVMTAFMPMKKLEIAAMEAAFRGDR